MKYKVGEKVRVVKKSNRIVSWNSVMNKSIGMSGVISGIIYEHHEKMYYVVDLDISLALETGIPGPGTDEVYPYSDTNNKWSYDPESLESERKSKLKRVLKDV